MSRGFTSRFFFARPPVAPPDYKRLIQWFGGDAARASQWVDAWIAYTTSGVAEQILAAASDVGSGPVVLTILRAKPLVVDTNFAMALQPPMRPQDDIETYALLPDGAISVEEIT